VAIPPPFTYESSIARPRDVAEAEECVICTERSAKLAGPRVFAIGNTFTALVQLNALLVAGAMLTPALVIGVLVGLVYVMESKELIHQTDVSHIVVHGR
jgi:precorrin isomerase